MDRTLDPNVKPLSADELAKDLVQSPYDEHEPALTEAQEGAGAKPADTSVISDGDAANDQSDATDRSLTRLPPG